MENLRNVKDVPLRQHPDLSKSVVDMEAVLEQARQGLFNVVDSCKGDKCLVFDPAVAGPLKLVLVEGSNTLKQHGVVNVMELNWADLEVGCEQIIYIVRPESKTAMQIASQVSHGRHRYRFQIHFAPRRSFLCDQILRNHGVFDLLKNNIYEYELGFIPYDTDVLSLGLDACFSQANLQSDDSTLMYSARALLQLQDTFGAIPHIQVKGDHSKKVLDMILRMRLEAEEEEASETLATGVDEDDDSESDGESDGGTPTRDVSGVVTPLNTDVNFAKKSGDKSKQLGQVDTLLLIDRNIDLVTPMCTALTYESVIDNLMGIRNGHAMVDFELVEAGLAPQAGEVQNAAGAGRRAKVSMSLNSSDHIYKEVRDMNIDVVLSHLNQKARDIKDNWQDVKGKEVGELYGYVQNSLKNHVQESQLLPRHINIVNRIRDTTVYDRPFRKMWTVEREILEGGNQIPYIEECIARHEPWTKVLRLACLQSLVGNGISQGTLDALRKSIVQTYGFELIFTLDNLEKLGMLKKRVASPTWPNLVSTFRLIPAKVDISTTPDDIAYVTSGYAPLSVRVVQLAIRPGWENGKEMMKKLAGRTIYKVKQPGIQIPSEPATESEPASPSKKKKKVMLVFFTGGVTFAEISALRFVSSQPDCPYDIIVASTTLINGKTILRSVAHEMENRLRQT
mmetsp:Transcript_28480/g.45895  ORF Transcript_28480/g.45895 Transcript_28480/m.45895 type:complete len:678 (-) Transcript_28480:85-2118(-)|eukprot:CAMPEP_0203754422 /NCGR_PEP_ID=MMETSP0098-20131031/8011_1 /ASSEMBLY_ACC=CAM_ASM_000208 /TAXON_ID=96639 /ORGANISM=" , Strain NY0313808BC1" /LENGTH=677 /DNA_ID=CAMNT_0050645411 /DNA_START=95 /DNA_END=2128 /DNA_ORIENTATION=+